MTQRLPRATPRVTGEADTRSGRGGIAPSEGGTRDVGSRAPGSGTARGDVARLRPRGPAGGRSRDDALAVADRHRRLLRHRPAHQRGVVWLGDGSRVAAEHRWSVI